jgi:hypothetical protein
MNLSSMFRFCTAPSWKAIPGAFKSHGVTTGVVRSAGDGDAIIPERARNRDAVKERGFETSRSNRDGSLSRIVLPPFGKGI